jgi:hypothetical protein
MCNQMYIELKLLLELKRICKKVLKLAKFESLKFKVPILRNSIKLSEGCVSMKTQVKSNTENQSKSVLTVYEQLKVSWLHEKVIQVTVSFNFYIENTNNNYLLTLLAHNLHALVLFRFPCCN